MATLDLNKAFGSGGLTLNSMPGLSINPTSGKAAQATYAVGTGRATPIPRDTGSVLGASTTGGGSRESAWRASGGQGDVPTGWNGSGGGVQGVNESDISDAYAPLMSSFSQMEDTARSGYGIDVNSLESQVANESGKMDTNQAQLLGATDREQNKFNNVLQSALADAVRSYNALQQQGKSRFGGGSSAGQAVGELANQEYLRQQGQIGQKGVEGAEEFGVERGKIRDFIMQKKTDLDVYKQTAMGELKKSLDNTLAGIASQRGVAESNKTRDRIAALEGAKAAAQAIASQDTQFRQQLALGAISQLQTISGKVFTPAQIVAYMQDFQNQLVSGGNINGASNSGSTAFARNPNITQDEFEGLQI